MSELTKERAVRIALIPEPLYKKLEKQAKEEDVSVVGLICRALFDYLDKGCQKKQRK
jgi:hypothetical protein